MLGVIEQLMKITSKQEFTPQELFRLLCDNKDDLNLSNEQIAALMSMLQRCPLLEGGIIDLDYPIVPFVLASQHFFWLDLIDTYIASKN